MGQSLKETDGTRSAESSQPSQAGDAGRRLFLEPSLQGRMGRRGATVATGAGQGRHGLAPAVQPEGHRILAFPTSLRTC